MNFTGKIISISTLNSTFSKVELTVSVNGGTVKDTLAVLTNTSPQLDILKSIGTGGRFEGEFLNNTALAGLKFADSNIRPVVVDTDKVWLILDKSKYNSEQTKVREDGFILLDRIIKGVDSEDKEAIYKLITALSAGEMVDLLTLAVASREDWLQEIINSEVHEEVAVEEDAVSEVEEVAVEEETVNYVPDEELQEELDAIQDESEKEEIRDITDILDSEEEVEDEQ